MGAGKSTVGRLLAGRLGWRFLDLDTLIEVDAADTISNLFRVHGEPGFRRLESLALVRALAQPETVLALGGGAPETLTNRLLLEQTPGTLTVFLAAPFATLLERCLAEAAVLGALHRPNLQDRAAAEARFQARLQHYRRLAHLTLDTTALSPEQATDCIVRHLAR